MNKDDKKTIYEIYSACRLCGGSYGYKMPIIWNIIQTEETGETEEVGLREKIKDCLQIEVDEEDRMPPLICEVCADKVDEYYQFLKLCQHTNRQTRLRLGLPLQTHRRGASSNASDTSNCILGMTEKVYINSDSEGEPLAKQTKSKPKPKSAKARELEMKIKAESKSQAKDTSRQASPEPKRETRSKRSLSPRRYPSSERSISPKRITRQSRSDDIVFDQVQDDLNIQKIRPNPNKLSKKERKMERKKEKLMKKIVQKTEKLEELTAISKTKRPRDASVDSNPIPVKKARMKAEDLPREGGLTSSPSLKKEISPGYCSICVRDCKTAYNLFRHTQKQHRDVVTAATPEPPKNESKRPGPKSKTVLKSQPPAPKSQPPAPKSQPPAPKSQPPAPKSQPPGPKSQPFALKPQPPAPKQKPDTKNKIAPNQQVANSKAKRPEASEKIVQIAEEEKKLKKNEEAKVKKKEEIAPKNCQCLVCDISFKHYQKLAAHNLKMHLPTFTPLSRACNPCELWFSTDEETEAHHNKHDNNMPYTCSKCYDDFVDLKLYDLHFINNQCLSTYEAPDVKCDECWKTFPTYKLLEDHKCLGESARPGGNCSKCGRKYSLLKNQIIHEMKCSGKKSVEPIDPMANKMLPMQVRLVRCDALLKSQSNGTYDVSSVSHTFGLDGNHSYPYFYSKGAYGVKGEPFPNFDHMVAIKDEIKEEFLQQDFVHWDSEEENIDQETSVNTPKSKTVEPLLTLSLKTLFSPKCLGKVPRKRKILTEKPFDSILSIKFSDDIRRNIDKIINNLESDGPNSDSYDSDSILGKIQRSIDRNDLFDSLSSVDKESSVRELDNNQDVLANETENQCINEDADSVDKTDDTANQTKSNEHEGTRNLVKASPVANIENKENEARNEGDRALIDYNIENGSEDSSLDKVPNNVRPDSKDEYNNAATVDSSSGIRNEDDRRPIANIENNENETTINEDDRSHIDINIESDSARYVKDTISSLDANDFRPDSRQESSTDCSKDENKVIVNKDLDDERLGEYSDNVLGLPHKNYHTNDESENRLIETTNSIHLTTDNEKSRNETAIKTLEYATSPAKRSQSELDPEMKENPKDNEHSNLSLDCNEKASEENNAEDSKVSNGNDVFDPKTNESEYHSSTANSECDSEAFKAPISDINGDAVSLNSLKDSVTGSDITENNYRNDEPFTITDDDDTKNLMDELDAQIGENQSGHDDKKDVNVNQSERQDFDNDGNDWQNYENDNHGSQNNYQSSANDNHDDQNNGNDNQNNEYDNHGNDSRNSGIDNHDSQNSENNYQSTANDNHDDQNNENNEYDNHDSQNNETDNQNNENDDQNDSRSDVGDSVKKNNSFCDLMQRNHDDLKSLELDNISDEEFNFDL